MDRERWLHGGDRGDGGGSRFVVQDLQRPQQQQRQMVECFSDEANSRDGDEEEGVHEHGGRGAPVAAAAGVVACGGKRRRGRPPGSKNKPKPPPVVTRDVEPAAAMRPHVLEVPAGGDVARALAAFARRRGLGICVLSGTGAVADVSLRHPSSSSSSSPPADGAGAAVVVLRGRYEILSVSATFLPPSMSAAVLRAAVVGDLSVSLAGPHGQIVGGAVAGPLVAASTVVVLAAAFSDLTFHRLPLEDEASASVSGSGEAAEHRGHRQPVVADLMQDASVLHPHSMAPATQQQAPLYARQAQDVWPAAAANAQRPRPPYQ